MARFLLDEEIAAVQVIAGVATSAAPAGTSDPMLVVFETESGRIVTDEIYVRTGVAYEVRTEVVGERGSAIIGLDQNLQVKTTDGRWGGRITPGFVRAVRGGVRHRAAALGGRRPDAAPSTGPAPGTATPPSRSARPASRRSAPVEKVAVTSTRGRSPNPAGDHRARPGGSVGREARPRPADVLRHQLGLRAARHRGPAAATTGWSCRPRPTSSRSSSTRGSTTPGSSKLKKVAADAGVGIASVLPVQRWSGPDEDQRQAAVRAWKRIIQITVDLGVEVINTEFNGRPEAPETAEAQFLKSMDELLPIFEREGLQLIIEPHPDDFIEDGLEAVEPDPRAQPATGSASSTAPRTPSTRATRPADDHRARRGQGALRAPGRRLGPHRLATACATSPTRRATRPGCTSTWRWAAARSTTTPSSPRWPPSASTAWSPAACSAGRRTPTASAERQRDKALALIGKHFGTDAEAAVTANEITR